MRVPECVLLSSLKALFCLQQPAGTRKLSISLQHKSPWVSSLQARLAGRWIPPPVATATQMPVLWLTAQRAAQTSLFSSASPLVQFPTPVKLSASPRIQSWPVHPTPSPGRAATRIFCLNHPPRLFSKQPMALVWASLHWVRPEFFTPLSRLQTSDSHGKGTGEGGGQA